MLFLVAIFQFQAESICNVVEKKKVIKEYLEQHLSDKELVKHVTDNTTKYIERYLSNSLTLELPSNLTQEQIEKIQALLKKRILEITNPIILERILLEIDLFQKGYR